MFVAIIAAHYNQFARENKGEANASFVETIVGILKANFCRNGNKCRWCAKEQKNK